MTCFPRLAVATLLLSLGLVLTGMPSAQAASSEYALDPVHTRVMIAVGHAGFSNALGTVSGSSGQLRFDPQDWTTAQLEVEVPLQHLDFGDEKWNQAVLAGNLLDTEKFPTAHFISTRIEPIDPQHASVYGTLTLHGVSREVKLDVTLNALKRHPLPPFRRTAGFSATAAISRAEFGIDAWKSVIGDRVELRLEVEATRMRNDGSEDDNDEDHATPTPTTEPTTP
ncbi:MAG TPA: YceI family protein [Pseudoxanthomonas sp.]|nr:YceI family protein [Pseudoxanthomonas sp.]